MGDGGGVCVGVGGGRGGEGSDWDSNFVVVDVVGGERREGRTTLRNPSLSLFFLPNFSQFFRR